jgi:hypothetical protein
MTMTFELNEELLSPAVRRLFGANDASVKRFEISALKPGAGNPVSLGVYRVSGEVELSGSVKPFSLVVKHLADGRPHMDASSPTGWNFWAREMEFFESPLADRIPQTIGHPKYLGKSTLADGSALFWNADLGDLEKDEWTWANCLEATRLVSELNSIKSDDLYEFEWLNRSQVDGWAELHEAWKTYQLIYPMLVELSLSHEDSAEAYDFFGKYLDRYDYIGSLLKGGRHSFVHGDFNLNNLVPAKGDSSLIALDWQLCGEARIGTEVAAIYNTAIEHKVIQADASKFEELCVVYTNRFNEINADSPIELDEVRLAAASMGYFILVNMTLFFMNFPPPETEAERRERLQVIVNDFTSGPVTVYARVLRSLE